MQQAHPDEPVRVNPDATVNEALEQMTAKRHGSVVVCEGDRLAGIFTERDVVRLLSAGADLNQPIRQVMTPNPVTIAATDSVEQAITKMSVGGYRRLPVVDDQKRPVGLLKVSMILRYLVEHFPKFVYNLPPKSDDATSEREGA